MLPARAGDAWGTFAILDAAAPSELQYVELTGGSGSSFQGERLGAMLFVRETTVILQNVALNHARGDAVVVPHPDIGAEYAVAGGERPRLLEDLVLGLRRVELQSTA